MGCNSSECKTQRKKQRTAPKRDQSTEVPKAPRVVNLTDPVRSDGDFGEEKTDVPDDDTPRGPREIIPVDPLHPDGDFGEENIDPPDADSQECREASIMIYSHLKLDSVEMIIRSLALFGARIEARDIKSY